MPASSPFRVILIGAGHAHLHVAAQAEKLAQEGLHLTLVDPGRFWYSGMAAGMLSGDYSIEQTSLPLENIFSPECGTLLPASLVNIDTAKKRVQLSTGEERSYDLLSLNIGSEVAIPFPVSGECTLPVKPLQGLSSLLSPLHSRPRMRIVIVGGGATGCEIAASLASGCRAEGIQAEFTLLTRSERILPKLSRRASRQMGKALETLGVEIRCKQEIQQIENETAFLHASSPLTADLFLLATGLRPHHLINQLPLQTGKSGGVLIGPTLQSVSAPDIFAAGDCADFAPGPLPRLGVYGVRQGPILLENIRRRKNGGTLQAYTPQKRALQILQTGKQRGLFVYGPLVFEGKTAFQIKSWIDRRFLDQYR